MDSKFIKIEGNPDLCRDADTNAIINKNAGALEKAKAMKQKRLSDKNRLDTLEKDVSSMKNTLDKIFDMLTKETKLK